MHYQQWQSWLLQTDEGSLVRLGLSTIKYTWTWFHQIVAVVVKMGFNQLLCWSLCHTGLQTCWWPHWKMYIWSFSFELFCKLLLYSKVSFILFVIYFIGFASMYKWMPFYFNVHFKRLHISDHIYGCGQKFVGMNVMVIFNRNTAGSLFEVKLKNL